MADRSTSEPSPSLDFNMRSVHSLTAMAAKPRVVIVTASHLSQTIRAVKEATALSENGFQVNVISTSFDQQTACRDQTLGVKDNWQRTVVKYGADNNWPLYQRSRIRKRVANLTWEYFHKHLPQRLSCLVALRAIDRVVPELVNKAISHRADLYIAHGVSSLPVAALAAERIGATAGYDIEDLYTGMDVSPAKSRSTLNGFVESKFIRRCRYLTSAAPSLSTTIERLYGVRPVTIRNTFSKRERPSRHRQVQPNGPLRLVWMSLTIGRHRGLEDAIHALASLPKDEIELHVVGKWQHGYEEELRSLCDANGVPWATIHHHGDVGPEEMIQFVSRFDVGLALEVPISANRLICMNDLCTNKVFTFLLAGLALACSSLEEPRSVFDGGGQTYQTGQPKQLATMLCNWICDRRALAQARQQAWRIADERFNWECESTRLINAVRESLSVRTPAKKGGSERCLLPTL